MAEPQAMGSHTPGPWELGGAFRTNVLDSSGHQIAAVCLDRDALLIAAAPELLEACEAALPVLRTAVESGLHGFSAKERARIVREHSTVKKLSDALAKARGEA